ncbi:MAG: hypothetical protein ACK5LN_01345 [Propioniciclava sp.]
MTLREQLTGLSTPTGYTLLTPPGWGRFLITDAGREHAVNLLSTRFKHAGRPELYAEARAAMHRQWSRLASSNVQEIFMPIEPQQEGGTPLTIATSPWAATGDFEANLRARVGNGRTVEHRQHPDLGSIFRWVTERDAPDSMPGLKAREVTSVVPFPGEAPQRGLLIVCSIVHLGVDESGPALDAFTMLADAIISTLRWRFA